MNGKAKSFTCNEVKRKKEANVIPFNLFLLKKKLKLGVLYEECFPSLLKFYDATQTKR